MSHRQRSGTVSRQPKTGRTRSEGRPQYVLADNTISLEYIKAIIFDMDGVITSSAREHAASWKRMFDEYLEQRNRLYGENHTPFDMETDYRLYIDGKPRYDGAKSFLESRNIFIPFGAPDDPPEAETICGLANRKNQYFLEHIKKYGVNPFPSSVKFVERMKSKGIRVGIISASLNAREVMQAAGVSDLFDAVVEGRESVRLGIKGKPAPDIFLEAARRLNVNPTQAAIVEDALAGIEAGTAGGFALVIGIDRDEQTAEMKKRGADIIVKDLSELKIKGENVAVKSTTLPFALDKKHEIFQRLQEGRPAIFLDYDGTLTPIVTDPDQAVLPPGVRNILQRLAEYWTVAIMSGRALLDVKNKVGLDTIAYAGSHGFNIEGPGESFHDERGQRFLPFLKKAEVELINQLGDIRGVRVERKPYALAVHYRLADDKDIPELERRVINIVRDLPELKVTLGKKVFEVRPNVNWNKGSALLYLNKVLTPNHTRVIPLYIGDDTTDEDAFQAISGTGIGILVTDTERETAAHYVLRDPSEVAIFLEEMAKIAEKGISRGIWTLVYPEFNPAEEQLREALCSTGNGYFATRGAAPESTAGDVHYPGTYMAGIYNRLKSTIAGMTIENESLVNIPNWLPLTFRTGDGDWFDLQKVNILEYRSELDIRRGVLFRTVRFADSQGRHTRLTQRRFVHIYNMHLAGLETTIVPEDWSGTLQVHSAIDGRVENTLVKRYRQLNNHHLMQIKAGTDENEIIRLQAETNQSHIRIAEAARTRVFRNGQVVDVKRETVQEPGYIGQEFNIDVRAGEPVRIEKIAALYNSRDVAISESLIEAEEEIRHAEDFAALLDKHVLVWDHFWELWHITLNAESTRMAQILNLHIYHLLQTVSPNTVDLDVGVPPRGLNGEAYRGLIMWDELFIFPLLNLRMPEITRSLLKYHFHRLPAARRAAKIAGYAGAMFPWQSGSNGREEAQTLHLNPESGRWIPDLSRLELHNNVAIPYTIWQYYQVTRDLEFLAFYGAEIFIDLARFWSSKAFYNHSLDRYEIRNVIGPDEFHDRYPDSEEPGIHNNAYTNIMVVWLMCRALEIFDILSEDRRKSLRETLGLSQGELARWDDISRKMRIVFHDDGIISQFEGYGDLKEFDWEGYRKRYGNIHRLDRILEAEGDTANRYKVSKQADVLMLFYLLSAEELSELFSRLGYPFEKETIPKNVQYYLERTSHGSTLSRVVHSWVLARSGRDVSWNLFREALESDICDIQGGTTHEGIHLGAMAGTVDIVQRAYSGIETRGEMLRFNPSLPRGLESVQFDIRYRGHWLDVFIGQTSLRIISRHSARLPIKIAFRDEVFEMKPQTTLELELGARQK